MKKSLIALAVAGVVSAPAFAATANVDVYGKLHMAVSLVDDQPSSINDVQISSNASRIGFKGAEDLGGGLSAIWQIESGVSLDEQNGTFASRNSFVGVKGGFGTVLLGNHDTPLKLVGRAVDLFGDTIADSRNVMNGGSDTRAKNAAVYMSPSFSGLSFAAAYLTDFPGDTATTGDVDNKSAYNLNATYSNGPLFLGLGFGDGDGHEAAGLGRQWRAAAGYTFGAFKLVGQYDSLDDDNSTSTVGLVGDYSAWMLGGSFTMGAMVFKANYMDGDIDNSSADPKQWTVGMDYNLSKRTAVYALYTDGEYVTLGAGGGISDRVGSCSTCSGDVSGFSVGLTHTF
ncbi:MAG TPA: porin [Thiobacillus sp.]|nr:porin [Thiobacillus sp.]